MDILQYLIELLKNRKQIGIEGLGTLYKKKTPGRYDAETHSFLPPSYTLQFKTDVLEHTNLAEYIQNKRGISEDSAKYFISQFVEEINKALQNGDYEMENLGTFSKLGEELIFIPDQDINTGFDFFALPPINAQLLTQKEQEAAIDVTDVDSQSPLTTTEEAKQVQRTEVEETNKIEHNETPDANLELIEKQKVEEPILDSEEIASDEVTPKSNELSEDENLTAITDSTESEEIDSNNNSNRNEITDPEITEEPAKVDMISSTEEPITVEKDEENENLTWDFNNESVVSEEDISKEDVFVENHATVPSLAPNEDQAETISYHKDEETEGVKLKSTKHEWDFNNIKNKKAVEENTLIGEFDQENFEEELTVEKTSMPLYQKMGFGLIALLVLIVILYFAKPSIFENFQRDTTNPDEKLAVPIQRSNLKTQKDSISFADSIMKNAERVGLDVLPARDTLEVTTSKKEVPTTYTFDIIIASFATDAKAQEYIARMKKKGFDAKLSTMHGKRKNISIATYNNIDSAQKYVTKFRKQFKNEDIYAQPIKNK